MKTINEMTRKDFERLPVREWREDVGSFDSLIILPLRKLHDSGYRMMDFVAVKDGIPFCRLSGGTDVINIEGIGGYGKWIAGYLPNTFTNKAWQMDCLKKSGLLRLYCVDKKLRAGEVLSAFDIFSVDKETK